MVLPIANGLEKGCNPSGCLVLKSRALEGDMQPCDTGYLGDQGEGMWAISIRCRRYVSSLFLWLVHIGCDAVGYTLPW